MLQTSFLNLQLLQCLCYAQIIYIRVWCIMVWQGIYHQLYSLTTFLLMSCFCKQKRWNILKPEYFLINYIVFHGFLQALKLFKNNLYCIIVILVFFKNALNIWALINTGLALRNYWLNSTCGTGLSHLFLPTSDHSAIQNPALKIQGPTEWYGI